MVFSQRLEELMRNTQTTAYRLAKSIGVHPTSIKNWLNGMSPNLETVNNIAAFFNVSTDYLLGKTDIKKAPYSDAERGDIRKAADELMKGNTTKHGVVIMESGGDTRYSYAFSKEEFETLKKMADLLKSKEEEK